jgi:hypothetical protein
MRKRKYKTNVKSNVFRLEKNCKMISQSYKIYIKFLDLWIIFVIFCERPGGLMDKTSVFGAED